ncbi:MAG: MSHA biogenesis protein MshJ [Gammaproteobacteria bacterium]|jgi:MSHA biogenesis protein MshJ
MNESIRSVGVKFNSLSIRERALVGITLVVVIAGGWWHFYAQPLMLQVDIKVKDNERIANEINSTRLAVRAIRNRIAEGVHREKAGRLAALNNELTRVEERLRLKTVELIDPAHMFDLMSQLIYQDSKLSLTSLSRKSVRPAILIPKSGEQADSGTNEAQIYRHIMVVEFTGGYLDILAYVEQLEGLDWKLIWDEIEIVSVEYPRISVKLVISTLSTRKEWVGV